MGSGGAEDPNTVVKQSVDGFKWRLLVSYDGTRYKGFLSFLVLISSSWLSVLSITAFVLAVFCILKLPSHLISSVQHAQNSIDSCLCCHLYNFNVLISLTLWS